MSRLLCLTELLRRLARPGARRPTSGPPNAPGASKAYSEGGHLLTQVPLTWGFGEAETTIPHHNETPRRPVSESLVPEICMSEVMSFFVL